MLAKRCFPPVIDSRSRLLILGSLPGDVSLARGQYYGHPQNQFWRLLSAVIATDLVALDYQDRLDQLLAHRIALWDVIAEAKRTGSLDGAIRDASTNDLAALIDRHPSIAVVAFNGNTAARIGSRLIAACAKSQPVLVTLPSSSPAYTRSFESKCVEWRHLQRWINPPVGD